MSQIEVRKITPDEIIGEIEVSIRLHRENKYAFQVRLKDLDFDINQELLEVSGLNLPFSTIQNAERALTERVIVPVKLIEDDDLEHDVIEFDPRPVGYSGFMDCVTHSLVMTNHGLFEVGHYLYVAIESLPSPYTGYSCLFVLYFPCHLSELHPITSRFLFNNSNLA
jgi:hypothetical protein